MASSSLTDKHGLVQPWERDRAFRLETVQPSPHLEHIVDRHWIVSWDLRSCEPFRQETLPHPSVNLVVEPHGAWIWGVATKRDVRLLQGEGWAVGMKFVPGAFTVMTGIDATHITDDRISVDTAFGEPLDLSGRLAAAGLPGVVDQIESRLTPRAEIHDASAEFVADVIESMRQLAPDARVADLAAMHYVGARTLQRLFRRYIGVGPKWVLQRLRIHEAIERLTKPKPPSWTELALELGYYDHAHFIRDFRLVVGRSPAQYAAEANAAQTLISS